MAESRGAAWGAALALIGVTLGAQLMRLAEPDMAFMLYAAGRMLNGAKLYRDVVDVNPPMIFAFNVPIAWLARVVGISDILLGRFATAFLVGSMLLLVRRLLKRYLLPTRATARRYVLLVLCFILFPLSREDFGQREHLVLGLLLPGFVIAVARSRGEQIGTVDAIASGVLSAIGLAVKPQFTLAMLGVEVWRRLRGRAGRWLFTPELAALLVTSAAYGLALVILTPDFLRLGAQLGPAYTTYLRIPLLNLVLFSPGAALTAFALLAAVALWKQPDGGVRGAVAVATIGCFLAGVTQQKGLRYHFYPSFALATLLLSLVAAQSEGLLGLGGRLYVRVSKWLLAAIAAVIVASTILGAIGGRADKRRRAEFQDLVETVRAHAHGEPIGMLSYYMGSAFPLVNYAGVGLASRYPCLWILPASYWSALWEKPPLRYHAPAEMQPPERMLNDAVAGDLLRGRPRLILILRPLPDVPRYGLRRLNYVAYFDRRPDLANLFAQYQLIATKGQYDVYEHLDSGAARSGSPPSSIVVPPEAPRRGQTPLAQPSPVDAEFAGGAAAFVAIAAASLLLQRRPRAPSTPA